MKNIKYNIINKFKENSLEEQKLIFNKKLLDLILKLEENEKYEE